MDDLIEVTYDIAPGRLSVWQDDPEGFGYRFHDPRPIGGAFADHWVARWAENSDGTVTFECVAIDGTAESVEDAKEVMDRALHVAGWTVPGLEVDAVRRNREGT